MTGSGWQQSPRRQWFPGSETGHCWQNPAATPELVGD